VSEALGFADHPIGGGITMNVDLTGRHVVITPAIRTYVLKRLRKFTRILGDEIHLHVILDVEKERHSAEILLKSKILDLTGKGETDDLYSSILRAVDKLERQALKHKHKIIEIKRHRAKEKSVAEKSGIRARERSRAPRRGNGIMEEEAPQKPMHVEEAVLELGHREYPFVVFRNVESGGVNVLYRRKDGSLGLIYA
jgi:putative sigma-54 modulation protein